MRKILILDDEKNICISLSFALEDHYQTFWFQEPKEGLSLLRTEAIDLVLLDLKLGRYDGIEILKEIKALYPNLPVIIMTGFGSIDSSVEAVKAGAYHYVSKPIAMDDLRNLIDKALEHAQLSRQVVELNRRLARQDCVKELIGKSPAMESLGIMIEKVKNINSNILIYGESGTGKEIAARSIHCRSDRKDQRFEAVNCSAIPVNLLESEFFGHKKGAFTGADSDRKGKFEICHKGTLFLDEIGEMDLSIQAKLLRVLQDKVITPVGSNQSIQVDVRLIAATNRDLKKAVEDGQFREDLFYRLNVISIEIPPLRQRKEDIPLLLQHFIHKYSCQFGKQVAGARQEVIKFLESYDFPGNVRELENIIERAVVFSEGKLITMEDLPELRSSRASKGSRPSLHLAGKTLAEIEREAILETLKMTGQNRKQAAGLLGITERTLRNKLDFYALIPGEQA